MKDFIEFIKKNRKLYNSLLEKKSFTINEIEKLKRENIPISKIINQIKLHNTLKKKIINPEKFIFDQKGAQQSSSSILSEYHAKKMASFKTIADICCGNGMDLIAIASKKQKVFAVDSNPETILIAKYNSEVQGFHNIQFVNDFAENFSSQCEAIFCDPDRRIDDKRHIKLNELSPSFDSILQLKEITDNILVKVSPIFDYQPILHREDCSLEFISENGTLKEILICFGSFKNIAKRKAVILPSYVTLDSEDYEIKETSQIKKYIYEPDSAIIRAGLVTQFAYKINGTFINEHIAFITKDSFIQNEFSKVYEVLTHFNFNVKKAKQYIKEHQIGELIIKTKGFTETAEKFRKNFKLKGKNKVVLIIFRNENGHHMIFAKDLNN